MMNLFLRRRRGFIISLIKRNEDLSFLQVLFKQTEVEEGLIKILQEWKSY